MAVEIMPIKTLKRRPEFLRVRGGGRVSLPAFVIEGKPRVAAVPASQPTLATEALAAHSAQRQIAANSSMASNTSVAVGESARFGFTVTKKIGNAVVRNRIRRRLKAALAGLDPDRTRADYDYVVIAREAAFDRPFAALVEDLTNALNRVHKDDGKAQGRPRGPAHRNRGRETAPR